MVYCHCLCIHVHVLVIALARTHEDMLSIGGVCDTLGKFRFSGVFGVFYELGQYDLLYTL